MADVDVLFQIGFAADTQGAADAKRASSEVASAAESAAGRVNAASKSVAGGATAASRGYAITAEKAATAATTVGDAVSRSTVAMGTASRSFAAEMVAQAQGANAAAMAVNGLKVAMAALLPLFAITKIVQFGRAVFAGAIEAEDATNRLRAALEAQGVATERNVRMLKDQAQALQATSRHGDEAIMAAQALALNMGASVFNVRGVTEAALDMGAALGKDLPTSIRMLTQAQEGNAMMLGRYVPEVRTLTKEQLANGDAVDLVAAKYRGMAEKDIKTLGGAWAQLKNIMGDSLEEFGLGLTGASDLASAMRAVTTAVQDALPAIRRTGEFIGTVAGLVGDLVDGLLAVPRALRDAFAAVAEATLGAAFDAPKAMGGQIAEMQAEANALVAKRGNLGGLTKDDSDRLAMLDMRIRKEGEALALREKAAAAGAAEAEAAHDAAERLTDSLVKLGEVAGKPMAVITADAAAGFQEAESQLRGLAEAGTITWKQYADGVATLTAQAVNLTEASEKERKAREAAAEAAEREAKALRDSLAAIGRRVDTGGRAAEAIRNSGLALDDQAAALGKLTSALAADKQAIIDLAAEGKISWGDAQGRIADVDAAAMSLADTLRIVTREAAAAAEQLLLMSMNPSGEATAFVEEPGAPDLPAQDEGNVESTRRRFMGPRPEGRSAEGAEGTPFLTPEFIQEMIDGGQFDLLAEKLGMVSDGYLRLSDTSTMSVAAITKQAGASMAAAKVQGLLWQGLSQAAAGFVQMAISGHFSVKKLTVDILSGIATQAASQAIMEVALGYAALARAAHGDPAAAAEATMHFTSAKFFGIVAGVATAAAAGAKAAFGSDDSAGGGGRDRGTGSDLSTDESTSSSQDQLVGTSGRTINVTVTGSVMGTTPEQFAREIHSYLAEVDDEQGGRSSARG